MTELDIIIDSPIGALLFVSEAISVFVLLAILILKKGAEVHSILGYIYFFGIGFTNYASAMAYYEGMIPASTFMATMPISTLFLIMGIVYILPKEKTKFKIRAHIICMIISSVAFSFSFITQWYHFKVSLLEIFQWADLRDILVLIFPILVIGLFTALHFLSNSHDIYKKYSIEQKNEEDSLQIDFQEKIVPPQFSSRQDSEVIYKQEEIKLKTRGQ